MDDFVKVSADAFAPRYDVGHFDGGTGDDELEGAFATNILDGGPGADTFHAAATSGSPGDIVDYSDRVAPVTVTLGDNLPNDGEAGEGDLIESGIREVLGGQAGDELTSTVDETTLRGGPGNDTITFLQSPFDPTAFGGPGDDTIAFSGHTFDTAIRGNSGDDVITGSKSGFQVIVGGPGDDKLDGGRGNDIIDGGVGADRVVGGDGHDFLLGGSGADTIFARDGLRDHVRGRDGHDRARVDQHDVVSGVEELF
jgi:Ca2+-binding RTX toxin-like protein